MSPILPQEVLTLTQNWALSYFACSPSPWCCKWKAACSADCVDHKVTRALFSSQSSQSGGGKQNKTKKKSLAVQSLTRHVVHMWLYCIYVCNWCKVSVTMLILFLVFIKKKKKNPNQVFNLWFKAQWKMWTQWKSKIKTWRRPLGPHITSDLGCKSRF